jgi:Ca2+-binding EF-hand superfamily protein
LALGTLLLATPEMATANGAASAPALGGFVRVTQLAGTQDDDPCEPTCDASITISLKINGEALDAIERDCVEQLFAYFDRDHDGVLDAAESRRLPHPSLFGQLLRAPFPAWPRTLGTTAADCTFKSPTALIDFYRARGTSFLHLSYGVDTASRRLDSTLAAGKRASSRAGNPDDRSVGARLAEPWAAFDSNGDAVIEPDEVVRDIAYPSTNAGSAVAWVRRGASLRGRLPPPPDSAPRQPSWVIDVITEGQRSNEGAQNEWLAIGTDFRCCAAPPAHPGATMVWVRRARDEQYGDALRAERARLLASFRTADANNDGELSRRETTVKAARVLLGLGQLADRDGNQRLGRDELLRWLDLWQTIASRQVSLRLCWQPMGRFEILDGNLDGRLVRRELAMKGQGEGVLPTRLSARDDQQVAPAYRLLCVLGLGRAPRLWNAAAPEGPAWFVDSDRNRDGEVTPREFVGPRKKFLQLDTDQDGWISADEATAATR